MAVPFSQQLFHWIALSFSTDLLRRWCSEMGWISLPRRMNASLLQHTTQQRPAQHHLHIFAFAFHVIFAKGGDRLTCIYGQNWRSKLFWLFFQVKLELPFPVFFIHFAVYVCICYICSSQRMLPFIVFFLKEKQSISSHFFAVASLRGL